MSSTQAWTTLPGKHARAIAQLHGLLQYALWDRSPRLIATGTRLGVAANGTKAKRQYPARIGILRMWACGHLARHGRPVGPAFECWEGAAQPPGVILNTAYVGSRR